MWPGDGQPDFAIVVIDYVRTASSSRSKSLKLFLNSFRNHATFHEDCTVESASAFTPTSSRAGFASAAISIPAAACRSTCSGKPDGCRGTSGTGPGGRSYRGRE